MPKTPTAHLSPRLQIHITLLLQAVTATTATVYSRAKRPKAGRWVQHQLRLILEAEESEKLILLDKVILALTHDV